MLQGGGVALMASDTQSVLGRAFLKYADALALDDVNATYHFHVGRLLVAQGDYSGAAARLESALSWDAQHQLARFVSQSAHKTAQCKCICCITKHVLNKSVFSFLQQLST